MKKLTKPQIYIFDNETVANKLKDTYLDNITETSIDVVAKQSAIESTDVDFNELELIFLPIKLLYQYI